MVHQVKKSFDGSTLFLDYLTMQLHCNNLASYLGKFYTEECSLWLATNCFTYCIIRHMGYRVAHTLVFICRPHVDYFYVKAYV